MGQRIEVFCKIIVKKKYTNEPMDGFSEVVSYSISKKDFGSDRYFVSINNGDGKGWNWLKTDDNIEYTCDSEVEAMNYMSRLGWRMIKTHRDTDHFKYYLYNIIFKKEIQSK